jgi:uncharacterized Zn-finger protein
MLAMVMGMLLMPCAVHLTRRWQRHYFELVLTNCSFSNASQAERESFGEVIDASRQMISLSQSDITPTPRNMYGDQTSRSSPESYGFPQAHSAHSSISSGSGMHSNYGSSVGDYPLSDYSSASESVDNNHRTLPRPQVNNSMPPAPQSMMGQFSSKVSSSSQKKHKCKVCDKRFTRPSSLQTHIYSHTGEKRKFYLQSFGSANTA